MIQQTNLSCFDRDLIVRQVKPDELPKVIPLIIEHAKFEGAETPKITADKLQEVLFKKHSPILMIVAIIDERIVGYLSATSEFSTWKLSYFMHMDCLYVRSNYRNYQIGKKLMLELFKACKKRNIVNLQWQTPVWNTKAIQFYERLGAEPIGKVRFYKNL